MRALLVLGLLLLAACGASRGAAGPTPLPTPTAVERGQALFANKGCITCHENAALRYEGTIIGVGPNLTGYTASEEFLKTWLKDPAELRPGTLMPNLELKETEINDLIAFINRERK
jgi:cytochrome c oxidase subunit 2